MNLDAQAKAGVEEGGGDRAVPWVLMAAYLYYHRDTTILSDECYDWLTSIVREDFDFIRHPHKHLLASLKDSRTSSLFDIKEGDYPTMARHAASRLAKIPFRPVEVQST
jgi:hypothetical protein